MNIGMKRAALIAAGFVLGGAAFAAINSGKARKGCVSLVNKAIKLKESVAYSLESMKENVDDIVAEAKAMDDEDAPACCSCGAEEKA
ncbi:DUF6110 family protein [Synergistaceae bacterium OttesenSCG-928-I11]|nr:DUF6110 family protein [Synergistaceae bacterium OttesenSCG-928-I11]